MVTIWPLDELCLRLPNKKKNMFNYLILFTRYLSLVTYVTWHFVITCCLQFADQSFYSPSDRSVTFYRSLPIGLLMASNLKMAGISLLPPFALLPRKKRSPNLGSRSPESQLWLFTIHIIHIIFPESTSMTYYENETGLFTIPLSCVPWKWNLVFIILGHAPKQNIWQIVWAPSNFQKVYQCVNVSVHYNPLEWGRVWFHHLCGFVVGGMFFFGGLLGIGMSTTLLVLCWQDGGADAAAAASGSDGDQAASAAELWIKFEA